MGSKCTVGLVFLGLLCAACGREPHTSDTGYVGTWARGTDRTNSTMAIVKDGERYLWRGRVESDNDHLSVSCDWDGQCVQVVDRSKASEFTCRLSLDPETQRLRKECRGQVLKPDPKPLHYVDELVLGPDGLTLWSRTIERDGQVYESTARPSRDFRKVDDAVSDPPPGLSSPSDADS